jgi:hypothetical protein
MSTLGGIFIVIVVGVGRLTTLLLSALNVYLASFNLGAVAGIYMAGESVVECICSLAFHD